MKVGDLVNVDGVVHIVTSVTNGEVKTTTPLRAYIMRTRVVKYDGEWMSVDDVVNRCEQSYIDAMGEVKEMTVREVLV